MYEVGVAKITSGKSRKKKIDEQCPHSCGFFLRSSQHHKGSILLKHFDVYLSIEIFSFIGYFLSYWILYCLCSCINLRIDGYFSFENRIPILSRFEEFETRVYLRKYLYFYAKKRLILACSRTSMGLPKTAIA